MAPEFHYQKEDFTDTADIWSLGITIIEMIYGKLHSIWSE